jgi:3-oxoadipate CoA-transferase alpha subunit
MIGGFGPSDAPSFLIQALATLDLRDLTLICNGPTGRPGSTDSSRLVERGQVRKVICSFPVPPSTAGEMTAFERLYQVGRIELELVPQGTLVERMRAAGAGIGAFFTPTGAGTQFGQGKEIRTIDGQQQILEYALRADVALIRAHLGDTQGNLIYRLARRNFNPSMAMAAQTTIAEVAQIVEAGAIDADLVMTPGIFVQRLVQRPAA